MNSRSLCILLGLLAVCFTGVHAAKDDDGLSAAMNIENLPLIEGFPRSFTIKDAVVTIHAPQIDEWKNYETIIARAAVEVSLKGGLQKVVGGIRVRAKSIVDHASHAVIVYDRELLESYFPGLTSKEKDAVLIYVEIALRDKAEAFPLDLVLAHLGEPEEAVNAGIGMAPPDIFYSDTPALLMIFDGEPILAAIDKDSSLRYALNTNWDVFYDEDSKAWFLLDDRTWLIARDYKGPWSMPFSLSSVFADLPDTDNWSDVRKALPMQRSPDYKLPKIIVSTTPAELIETTGKPKLELIEGTPLSFVSNTEHDVFYSVSTNRYYFLTAGRWFSASALDGPWKSVQQLSVDFQRIPVEHPRGHVRASIAGTPEAKVAVYLAQIPKFSRVERDGVEVDVIYSGDPDFAPIEGTALAYAVNTSFAVIRKDESFYLCYEAVWFVSGSASGPWRVADSVPQEIYNIPAKSPLHYVTHVRIHESTDEYVETRYTSGYENTYVVSSVVVWGTGWYYPPYSYYYAPYYPYYYYSPYYTYGAAAYYNPATGTYGRGVYSYGPYGGCG